MRMLLWLFLCMLSLFTPTALEANQRCLSIAQDIRQAHYYYFGVDFPYWYAIAQAEKESLCRHSVISSDGVGSEGFAQITWKWWSQQLSRAGIPEIKSIRNHARAQAYIMKLQYDATYCDKLFEAYQRYNGGGLVTQELIMSNSCEWEDGYRVCRRKDVCVNMTRAGCKQYRNACDINYEYSLTIYSLSAKYRRSSSDATYVYW